MSTTKEESISISNKIDDIFGIADVAGEKGDIYAPSHAVSTTNTPFEKRVDEILLAFAIAVHETKPGEDETSNFDNAKAALTQLHEATLATATSHRQKTHREFRNALYEYLTGKNVTDDTATLISREAELYVEAYHAYQLRGIEFAAKEMGFRPTTDDDK